MKYIGCDFHPSFQVIAMLDKETGELVERRLLHTEEARSFYQELQGPVVVGIEASGNTHWFESLLARWGHELGSDRGRTRCAAVVDPSSASGTDAESNQEPAAAHCPEPGLAEETQAVE